MSIKKILFGKTPDGTDIDIYTLTNKAGMKIKALNYGSIITELWAPDKNGQSQDVILGHDNFKGVLADTYYLGAVIGRYANRIAGGTFSLDGKLYQLAQNSNGQHLHGGNKGFDKVIYQAAIQAQQSSDSLVLRYLSKNGEEGYPGNLELTVRYSLADNNEFTIDYTAVTDKRTVVNFTNHMYFNLAAGGTNDILPHELVINADKYTPVDRNLIPTGELASLAGTPLDFSKPTAIGARINDDFPQMQLARGYDHNYVLKGQPEALKPAARVYEPNSGRLLEVSTTEPGIQFYSGNFLDGTVSGKGSRVIGCRSGLCLEPQHFPDSPNHPGFPSTVLDTGQTFHSRTVYRFSTG